MHQTQPQINQNPQVFILLTDRAAQNNKKEKLDRGRLHSQPSNI